METWKQYALSEQNININEKDTADNTQFWKTIKSLFYDKIFMIKITPGKGDKVFRKILKLQSFEHIFLKLIGKHEDPRF